jgi:hypothetical protein
MKKLFVLTMFLTAALGLFAQQGSIRNMAGTVELKPAGAAAFVTAKIGDQVAAKTIISTGFKSTAIITVGSTTIAIQALTRMSLTEIIQAQGTEKVDIQLQSGRVRVEVRPPVGTRADTSVKTPSATASVRGTIFEMDTFGLTVTEGTVAYTGNDGVVVLVQAGGASRIDPVTGRAVDPVETGAAALTPPLPAGADSSDGSRKEAGQSMVKFTISVSY